jgi:hypothetical protein
MVALFIPRNVMMATLDRVMDATSFAPLKQAISVVTQTKLAPAHAHQFVEML